MLSKDNFSLCVGNNVRKKVIKACGGEEVAQTWGKEGEVLEHALRGRSVLEARRSAPKKLERVKRILRLG